MKKMKKILAMLLAMAMILGMSLTVFANPVEGDTATVTITNLTGNPTVTLYKIVEGVYGPGGTDLTGYNYVTINENGTEQPISLSGPTSGEITTIANAISAGKVTPFGSVELKYDKKEDGTYEWKTTGTFKPENNDKYVKIATADAKIVNGTYTCTVPAGAYIAIITGADDGSVYNPILLTATYNENGSLVAGQIDSTSKYLYGSTGVAKKTMPKVDKTVSGTIEDVTHEVNGEKVKTSPVGKELTYTVTPIMPSYPEEAVNKTFFLSDKMDNGLTFDFSSLEIKIVNPENSNEFLSGEDNVITTRMEFKDIDAKNPDEEKAEATIFTFHGKDIAYAVKIDESGNVIKKDENKKAQGFNLVFVYDNLTYTTTNEATEGIEAVTVEGNVYTPVVTYKAVVNENAITGETGNSNLVEYIYSNKPNSGETWNKLNKPEPSEANGLYKKEDKETVYTYQLAFKKIGEGADEEKLANAVFGIYTDEDCTNLIDVVTTNENGYAVSTRVAAGSYYVKEIQAPTGYSLNEKTYRIEANWVKAITTITGTVTNNQWKTEDALSAEEKAVAKQVGWIDTETKVFYEMNQFEQETETIKKAYLVNSTTTTTTTTAEKINTDGSGTATTVEEGTYNAEAEEWSWKPVSDSTITNTKLTALPSTGGIGTTIFTIGGCAIMIIAAGLFFATRRKAEK